MCAPLGHGARACATAREPAEQRQGTREYQSSPEAVCPGARGARGTQGLERAVGSLAAAVAFSLYPVSVSDLMAISDAGDIMPPKSTWFEPKLRDGLLIHEI